MPKTLKLLIAMPLCTLCAYLAMISANLASTNANYYQAQNYLSTKRNQLPKIQPLREAHSHISLALEQQPTDADILDLSGRIDYFLAIYAQDPSEKQALFLQSKAKHLAALKQRPLWPYSEVNILYSSSALGQIDAEFQERFLRASELGPDDRSVILDLARLGIKNWNDLSGEAKQRTVELTEQVLKRRLASNRELAAYMYNNGQFHRICAQLRQFPEKTAFCNS